MKATQALLMESPVLGRLFVPSVPLHIANGMLSDGHYLGPIGAARHVHGMGFNGAMVAVMVWRWPTARMIPSDGTWLELSRWLCFVGAGHVCGDDPQIEATPLLGQVAPVAGGVDRSPGRASATTKAER